MGITIQVKWNKYEYKVEQPLVAATVSITTLLSVATLPGWLYLLAPTHPG